VHAVSNLIREAKSFQLASVMQTSRKIGMRTLNDSLAELVRKGVVDSDEAMSKSVDKEALRSLLRGLTAPTTT
jgi:twitching motility protein PilT